MEAEFYAESQPPFLGSPCGLVLVSSLCKHVLAASNSEATVKRLCKLLARRNLPWVTLTLTHLLRSHVVKAAPADVAAVAAAGRPFGRFESSATGAEAAVGASNPRGEEPGHRLGGHQTWYNVLSWFPINDSHSFMQAVMAIYQL